MQLTFELSRENGQHLIRVDTMQPKRQSNPNRRKFDYCAPCDAGECGGEHPGEGCLNVTATEPFDYVCLCAWERSKVGSAR
jgi:hypothetical protein